MQGSLVTGEEARKQPVCATLAGTVLERCRLPVSGGRPGHPRQIATRAGGHHAETKGRLIT